MHDPARYVSPDVVADFTSARFEDLPAEVRKTLEVYPVENLGEVLALTLRGASFKEGKLFFPDQNAADVVALHAYHH